MSASSAVQAGRRAAESLMIDRCEIYRVKGVVVDPFTGKESPDRELVYPLGDHTGKCKVQTFEAYETAVEVSGHEATLQRYSLHIPVGSYYPNVGDHVIITETILDPKLNGNEYRITAPYFKSMATAYRMHIEELAS